MKAIEATGIFNENGELILKIPELRNKKVRLLILMEEEEDKEWYGLSAEGLAQAYGNDEPEYSLQMLKEKNPGFHP